MEFINGIEILDKTIITEEIFMWGTGSITSLILFISALVVGLIFAIKEEEASIFVLGFMVSLVLLIPLFEFGFQTIETDKYNYKVIISDEVNFNEFNEKYKILKQEGKIYTIRIKD